MLVSISTSFLKKIGISDNPNIDEYVDVTVNDRDEFITIKKHKI